MPSTSSSSSVYHDPLLVGTDTSQAIEDRLSDIDAALLTRQNNIATETSRAMGAEAAEYARATAAEAAEALARSNADSVESGIRANADGVEAATRATADATETANRQAADAWLEQALDALNVTASTSGGTGTTLLVRNAGAATIASIGGDGTTTTVTSSGAHGFQDGDYLTISGTTSYNGDYGPINVLSATQFTYASAISAATGTTGSARTKRLFIDDSTPVNKLDGVVGKQLTVTSDTGQLHTTTIAAIPATGQITMAAAVPASWTLAARASIGAVVSSTLEEVRLMRTAIGSNGALNAPQALGYAAGGTQNVRAYGALGNGTTSDAAAIVAAIAGASGSLSDRTVLFPPGDYVIDTQSGTGRQAVSLLVTGTNVTLRGAPGARLVIKDGACQRPLIVRNGLNVLIEGLEFVYQRSDGATASGICLENTSRATVTRCTVDGFPSYGVVVSEDTSTARVGPVSTISFTAGTNVIGDSAAGLGGIHVGDTILSTGALNPANNGLLHVTVASAGSLTVSEPLVTEAAGASATAFTSDSVAFNGPGKRITDVATYPFLAFEPGDKLRVTGTAGNNTDFTIDDIAPDGGSVHVLETVATEAAGAAVTIAKVNNVTLIVWVATACNDITIMQNRILNIGRVGIEGFGKVLSYNHTIQQNYVYNCGNLTGTGAGIKAGQGVVGAKIVNNHVAHCANGLAAVNWETMLLLGNQIENCQAYGIAATASRHPMYTTAGFGALQIAKNQLAYVLDFVLGTQFVPTSSGYAAINVNGLYAGIGLLDIADNDGSKWLGGAVSFKSSLVAMPNIAVRNNRFLDCGNVLTVPLSGTADTTSGSATITNVTTNGKNSTAGWHVGAVISGATIPFGATIVSINPAARSMVLSANATGAATASIIGSGRPDGVVMQNNTFGMSGVPAATVVVRVYSPNARIVNNLLRGYGGLALQVRGDGSLISGNIFTDLNPTNVAQVAPILLDEGGLYTLVGNHLHSTYSGSLAPTYFVNNNAAAGGAVTVVSDDTNRMYSSSIRTLFTGSGSRLKRSGVNVGVVTWDPPSLANGGMASTTVAVANAVVGDPVMVGFSSIVAAGWELSGSVTSAGTVTATLVNHTGGTVDLPSGNVTAVVSQL